MRHLKTALTIAAPILLGLLIALPARCAPPLVQCTRDFVIDNIVVSSAASRQLFDAVVATTPARRPDDTMFCVDVDTVASVEAVYISSFSHSITSTNDARYGFPVRAGRLSNTAPLCFPLGPNVQIWAWLKSTSVAASVTARAFSCR